MGKKTVEVQEMNILLRIPEDAVALEVTATTIGRNGKARRLRRTLSAKDIAKAREAFLENVEDGDDYDGGYVVANIHKPG